MNYHVGLLFKGVLKNEKWSKIQYFPTFTDLNVVFQLSVIVLDKSSQPLDVHCSDISYNLGDLRRTLKSTEVFLL